MPKPPITSSSERSPWSDDDPHGGQIWRAENVSKFSSAKEGVLHRMDGPAAILLDFRGRGYSLYWFIAAREMANVLDDPLFEKPIYAIRREI